MIRNTGNSMEQKMNQKPEPFMDQFYQDMMRTVPHLDPYLAMKIMRLNKELVYRPPHVQLTVAYKDGISLHEKQEKGRDKYPLQIAVSRWNDGVVMLGLMDMKLVQEICSDPDIVSITGEANAGIY